MAGKESSKGEKVMKILREKDSNKRKSQINELVSELSAERYAKQYIERFANGKNRLTYNRAELLGKGDTLGELESTAYSVIFINLLYFGSDSNSGSDSEDDSTEYYYPKIVPNEAKESEDAGEMHPGEKYLYNLIQHFYNKTVHGIKETEKNETAYNDEVKTATPSSVTDTVEKPKRRLADPLSIKEKSRDERAHEYFELYLKTRGLEKAEALEQFINAYKKGQA